MFYQCEDVDVCGICSKIYVDPRILPCGESACHACIQNVIQNDPMKTAFDCKFCQGRHEAPPGNQGFYLNLGMSKLIKANAVIINELASVKKLREKLAEIKSECEEFELSLDNGVDQVREHCILLRNQVHLRTDILIEEVHNFNESLIAEINKYEQECVDKFEKNIQRKSDDLDCFVDELNEFHTDTSSYLNEFKIKENVVEEAVAKADGHLKRLKVENREFKTMVFNGKILEFNNFPNKIGSDSLGSFVYKYVGLESPLSFQDNDFGSNFFKNYKSNLFIFMNVNGTNFGFFINTYNHLSLICFSNDGQIITHVSDALKSTYSTCSLISSFTVAESRNGFFVHVKFLHASGYRVIRGHALGTVNDCPCLVFMLDKKLKYSKHTFNITSNEVCHLAANDSTILMVDVENKYCYLNMNLDPIIKKSWKLVKNYVGQTIVDIQMNDQCVFFLSSTKLMIIEINSGEVVQQFETSADQIKLASNDYLVLFDSADRIAHVHEQAGEFRKLDEVSGKSPKFNAHVIMTCDKSNSFALFDLNGLRYMALD
jgi:hypothetical protein